MRNLWLVALVLISANPEFSFAGGGRILGELVSLSVSRRITGLHQRLMRRDDLRFLPEVRIRRSEATGNRQRDLRIEASEKVFLYFRRLGDDSQNVRLTRYRPAGVVSTEIREIDIDLGATAEQLRAPGAYIDVRSQSLGGQSLGRHEVRVGVVVPGEPSHSRFYRILETQNLDWRQTFLSRTEWTQGLMTARLDVKRAGIGKIKIEYSQGRAGANGSRPAAGTDDAVDRTSFRGELEIDLPRGESFLHSSFDTETGELTVYSVTRQEQVVSRTYPINTPLNSAEPSLSLGTPSARTSAPEEIVATLRANIRHYETEPRQLSEGALDPADEPNGGMQLGADNVVPLRGGESR